MPNRRTLLALAIVVLALAACAPPSPEQVTAPPTDVPATDAPPTDIPATEVPAPTAEAATRVITVGERLLSDLLESYIKNGALSRFIL